MRYLIPFIVAALLAFGYSAEEVKADYRSCNCARCQQVRRQHSPNMFQKLMDLERRKNAWLKRTFLGK